MKRFVCVLVVFGGLLLYPTLVSAHAGPGPPFLKVNGKYSQTNPYYQGDAAITVPQDIAPEKYLANRMILFEVDTSQLLVPADIAAHTNFRWTLVTGQTFTDSEHSSVNGMRMQRSFNHVGSYLLTLEAEGPGEYTYNIIDTVQVDIVPDLNYKTPTLVIDVGSSETKNNFSAVFVSKPTVDPSATVAKDLWDVGDKNLLSGMSQTKDYASSTPINYLYNRVIDSNGLLTDVGFDVWKNDTNLEFHPFGNMLKASMQVKDLAIVQRELSTKKSQKNGNKGVLIGSLGGVIVLCLFFVFLRPRKVS